MTRLLIAGSACSGKTALFAALADEEPSIVKAGRVAESTSIFGNETLQLMDSSSDPGDASVFTAKLLVADVVICVFDLSQIEDKGTGEEVLEAMKNFQMNKPVLLVGNKLDAAFADGGGSWSLQDRVRDKLTGLLRKYDSVQGIFFTSALNCSSLKRNSMCTPPQTILKHAQLHAKAPVQEFYKGGKLTLPCLRALAGIHCSLDKEHEGFLPNDVLLGVQDAMFVDRDRKSDVFKEMGLSFPVDGADLGAFVGIFTTLLEKYHFAPVLSLLSHHQWEYQDGELRLRPGSIAAANFCSGNELSFETEASLDRVYRSWASYTRAGAALTRQDVADLTGQTSWCDSYPNITQQYFLESGEPATVVLALTAAGGSDETVSLSAWIEYNRLLAAAVPAQVVSSLLRSTGCRTPLFATSPSRPSSPCSMGLVNCTTDERLLDKIVPRTGGDGDGGADSAVYKYVRRAGEGGDAEEKGEHIATTLLVMLASSGGNGPRLTPSSCGAALMLVDGRYDSTKESSVCGALSCVPDSIPRVVLLAASAQQYQEQWRQGLERARLPPPLFCPPLSTFSEKGNSAFDQLLQQANEAVKHHKHGGISHSQSRRLFFHGISSRIGAFWRALLFPFSTIASMLFRPLITFLPAEQSYLG